MRSLIKEFSSSGQNVNVVAPRVIQSRMLDSLCPTEESQQAIMNEVPIGRLGKPSVIFKLVQYVSVKEANYIHGQILMLDGGRTYQGK